VPWESYPYPRQLARKEVFGRIDAIAASGSGRMDISGGEPTLRRDLPDIIRYARAAGISTVELQTNAVLLRDKERTQALKDAGLTHAFVGLHSHIPKIHDFLVKSEGAFEACVEGTRNLVACGVATTVNPVLTTANFKHVVEFMRYVHDELPGVRAVSLSAVQPHGRARDYPSLMPRYGELSPYVERAVEEGERLGLFVNNPYCGLPLCIGGWHRRLDRCVEPSEAALGHPPGDGKKFHPEPCGPCSLKDRCGGVWLEYPGIHPVEDLRPIPAGGLP
jgi:MoaA/NifB/PqqE/SkfB family radical SAM enzyme